MASTPQPRKVRDRLLSALDVCIQAVNLAKDACVIPIAKTVFASANLLLTMIRVRFPHFAKISL